MMDVNTAFAVIVVCVVLVFVAIVAGLVKKPDPLPPVPEAYPEPRETSKRAASTGDKAAAYRQRVKTRLRHDRTALKKAGLLSVEQVARETGLTVHGIHQLCSAGEIPFVRIRGVSGIAPAALASFLDKRTAPQGSLQLEGQKR